ncbi:hypothetical protein XENTR_v10000580 [Xenopus tropicalis]|nr:hypothetical protein XENTR_v10000580 [Xenopus tropicalis]
MYTKEFYMWLKAMPGICSQKNSPVTDNQPPSLPLAFSHTTMYLLRDSMESVPFTTSTFSAFEHASSALCLTL